jgi:uncharacterized protein (AIM24 family)
VVKYIHLTQRPSGKGAVEYEIHGMIMQTLDVQLANSEMVYTESGGMAWMSGDIEMSTSTRGGLLKGLGRKLVGEY